MHNTIHLLLKNKAKPIEIIGINNKLPQINFYLEKSFKT